MPWPLSVMLICAASSRRVRETSTCPPDGVNLIALDRRLQTTCCSRAKSPRTMPVPLASSSGTSFSPFVCAAGSIVSSAASTTRRGSTLTSSRDTFPVTIRDASSKSSIRRFCARALRSIVSRARVCVTSSRRRVRRSVIHPKIAFSGVRSSCDIVARNSSLRRLKPSASTRNTFSRASVASRSFCARCRSTISFSRRSLICCSSCVRLVTRDSNS